MKKLCLFTFAVLLTFSVFAQSEKGFVYLKNGTILKGNFTTPMPVNCVWNLPETSGFSMSAEIDSVAGRRAARVAQWKTFRSIPVFFTAPNWVFWLEIRKTASRRRLVFPEQ
jgi:hypothetical protein